jgi:hypothetical protein
MEVSLSGISPPEIFNQTHTSVLTEPILQRQQTGEEYEKALQEGLLYNLPN